MFDIISMGEYTLLADAFNGLAMIFNSGPIANMMKLAFLVGILWFGVRAAFFTKWDATPLLAGLIGYMCMFGPKVDITITDGYSGAVRVVSNVPVGIAAPMAITSHTGRYFASTFEQAFAVITPGSSYFTEGYLNSIEVLLKMRAPTQGWASVAVNSRIEATLLNYIKDCVYLDLAMNDQSNPSEVDAYKLTTHPDTWAQMKTTFINVYTTDYIQMVGGRPQELPCNAVYNRLDAQIGSPGTWISTYYDNYLQTQMAASRQAFSSSAETRIGNALAAINLSAADARTWMMNTMLGTALRNADAAYQVGQNNIAGTVMVTQAAQQRNAKWAAERTMFEQVARPITAFIEMFMVGASPIMAFAIAAFGHAGFSILGKFLMMHVWVTLWVPTTALVNAYLAHTTAKYVEWVQFDRGIQLLSQSGLDQLNNQLQTQLATGGMLAAAVPMLTLMLIYGSSQVATQLASQMRGSEYIDPKIASPDIAQPSPVMQLASSYTGNPSLGSITRTGATVGAMNLGSAAQQGASLSRQNAETLSNTGSLALNSRYGLSESSNDRISVNKDGTLTGTSTFSQGVSAAYNKAYAAARASGFSEDAAKRFGLSGADGYANQAKINAGLQAPLGVLGVGKDWTSSWTTKEAAEAGVSSKQLEDAQKRLSQSSSNDQTINAGLSWAKSNRDSLSNAKDFSTGASQEDARTITKTLSQVQQQTDSATTLDSVSRNVGTNATYHPTQLAADWQRTFGGSWADRVSSRFDAAFADMPPEQAAAAKAAAIKSAKESGTFQNAWRTDPSGQDAMAKLWAMANMPAMPAGFVQDLGSVAGVNLGSTGTRDPATFRVNSDKLANRPLLDSPAFIQLQSQAIADQAAGRITARQGQAARWDALREQNFSAKALAADYAENGGKVAYSSSEWNKAAEKANKLYMSQIPGERAQLQNWFLQNDTEGFMGEILKHQDIRKNPPKPEGSW